MAGKKAAIRWNRKTVRLVLIVILVVVCAVLEIGERFPKSGLPGWQTAFNAVDGTKQTPSGELQVHFIDVGNADCILIRQGNETLLIDAGERGDADDILQYIRNRGITKLDTVIATHPHADHIGSMADVLRAMDVGQFIMAFMPENATPTTATYLSMLQAVDDKNIPLAEAKPGMQFTVGTAQITLLAPIKETDDQNDMSVVSLLSFGEKKFLFMGDAGTAVEKDILRAGTVSPVDVIKVGHHGSSSSSSASFIKKVDPAAAVITCGEGNSYGHPHKETIALLSKQKIKMYRSDVCGNIVFTTDGKELSVETEKEVG